MLDITSDLGIPSFVAVTHWMENSQEQIEFGSGAHFDTRIAVLRAMTELSQFLSIGLMGGRDTGKCGHDDDELRLGDHPYLMPSGNPLIRPDFSSKFGRLDKREQVMACVRLAKRAGPRFPRPRSDTSRHRGPGCQGDCAGIAALLSPLRTWPALRCPGKAWIARPATFGRRTQSAPSPDLMVLQACAHPEIKRRRRAAPATLFVRLGSNITLEVRSDGEIAACFYGHSVNLGKFSAGRCAIARRSCALVCHSVHSRPAIETVDKEIQVLAQRLAKHGLLEYRLGRSRKGDDLVVIEPQLPDYWPRMPLLRNTDTLVLSRFAYMRRRGNEMVLESPRAGALFRICDPKVATALALLSTPQQIKQLRRQDSFPGA